MIRIDDVNRDHVFEMLASLSLEEIFHRLVSLITRSGTAELCALAIWDCEMESFSQEDRFFFLAPNTPKVESQLKSFLDDLLEELEPAAQANEKICRFIEVEEHGLGAVGFSSPILLIGLRLADSFVGTLLLSHTTNADSPGANLKDQAVAQAGEISGDGLPSSTVDEDFLVGKLGVSSGRLARSMRNAWLHAELERENERLRSRFESIESNNIMLEEQTRKLIHDLTARDSIRMKQVERERLVYWISHLVRSSVRMPEVLKTAVERIGETLGTSRCHVIRINASSDIEIYEYHDENTSPAKELLLGEQGQEFTKLALSKKVPVSLDNPETDDQTIFDRRFLIELGMKSGLLVPMIMRDNVLGVLFLEDCVQSRDWSIDDISLLGSLADHLAPAIENAELLLLVEKQAVTDILTGVSNRRAFNDSLEKEFERAKRYEQPLSLVVIDLDFLKHINDTYGHITGDEAIRSIGAVLQQSSRSTDITARYGGEEFCVLLPNTEIDMATQLAERLRRLINETEIDGAGRLSASLGVSNFPLHASNAEMLFLRADAALYKAKEGGRNCVKVSDLAPDGTELAPSRTTGPV